MSNRERVQRAVEDPVDAAAQELRELNAADVEARLTVLINGWGRGVAAGLEELAVAIDELSRILLEREQTSQPLSPIAEPGTLQAEAAPASGAPHDEGEEGAPEPGNEQELQRRAKEAREAIAQARDEAAALTEEPEAPEG